ncbi:hypothetical protein BJ322DRAFT_1023550 [Thelephora terrestris]|uniref:Uncharacterized protein n=1 Tax=Thelephora terrestris TaxID=56493 RepID=A0A9P6L3P6_9AGAM|nr:hypothetical protein BJ322DRAFT_1023550 [Thelephora terrestris]
MALAFPLPPENLVAYATTPLLPDVLDTGMALRQVGSGVVMIRAVLGDSLGWVWLERAMVKETRCDSWDKTSKKFRKRVKVGTYVVLGEEAWPAEPRYGWHLRTTGGSTQGYHESVGGMLHSPREPRNRTPCLPWEHDRLRTILIQHTLRREGSARADGGHQRICGDIVATSGGLSGVYLNRIFQVSVHAHRHRVKKPGTDLGNGAILGKHPLGSVVWGKEAAREMAALSASRNHENPQLSTSTISWDECS